MSMDSFKATLEASDAYHKKSAAAKKSGAAWQKAREAEERAYKAHQKARAAEEAAWDRYMALVNAGRQPVEQSKSS